MTTREVVLCNPVRPPPYRAAEGRQKEVRGIASCVVSGALLLAGRNGAPKGDPLRGMEVHKVCLNRHGTGLYTSQNRKIIHWSKWNWSIWSGTRLKPTC